MTSVASMVKKCAGRSSVFLCLNDRTTTLDKIEVLPGLKANVLVQGHPEDSKRAYTPTVVELKCQDLDSYLSKRRWENNSF